MVKANSLDREIMLAIIADHRAEGNESRGLYYANQYLQFRAAQGARQKLAILSVAESVQASYNRGLSMSKKRSRVMSAGVPATRSSRPAAHTGLTPIEQIENCAKEVADCLNMRGEIEKVGAQNAKLTFRGMPGRTQAAIGSALDELANKLIVNYGWCLSSVASPLSLSSQDGSWSLQMVSAFTSTEDVILVAVNSTLRGRTDLYLDDPVSLSED